MNEVNRRCVLIVEPERDVGELFARALESRRDCKCYIAVKEDDAIELLKDIPFDLILSDMTTTMAKDYSLLKKIKRFFPDITLVVDGYLHQKPQINRALELGAHAYLIKPIKVELFRKKIEEFYTIDPLRPL
ncbi:MAG: response regulator [Syntrophobacteraceae bacterium]|nr:response regulator [Desulfobacteraceae bacterium]